MKVLLTGGSGQLGQALLRSAPPGIELIAPTRAEFDLADAGSLERWLETHKPAAVINAGAYTAVDKAESEPELAFTINANAPGVLAQGCARIDAKLVHLSTDFVFDGRRGIAYQPDDERTPLSVYGASKAEGERRIAAVPGLRWLTIRTAWVYAAHGKNFMLTMLRLFGERKTVSVVADQIGTPTSAGTLGACVFRALASEGPSQVLHYTDAGVASWYDFAVAIYEEARALGLLSHDVEITPITSAQYPTPARRPAFSVLDKRAALERLQLQPIHWRKVLRSVLKEKVG